MATGFERRVCEGPLCAGIRTHLVTQFHPSGVCYACATKQAHPAGTAPERKEVTMKTCKHCKHPRPEADFVKVMADGSERETATCQACRKKAMDSYLASRGKATKVSTTARKNAARPARTAGSAKPEGTPSPAPMAAPISVAVSPVKNGLLLAHGSRLLSIALLGPREHDSEFIRALCAGLLQDSLTEAGCKDLVELAAEEA